MRTSVNVPDEVLSTFDETWRAQGLDSRSRAVREAIREYVTRHTELSDLAGDAVATVVIDYEHGAVVADLHAIQHDFEDVVGTTAHMHHGERCLESIFCRGPAERIRALVHRLRDFDAVARVNVMFLAPAE